MSDEYHDPRITCAADGIAVHGYYIPWGTAAARSCSRPFASLTPVPPARPLPSTTRIILGRSP